MSFRSPSSRQLPRPMALGNGTEHENLYSRYLHFYFSQCDRLSWFCLYTFVFLIICHTFLASLRYFNFPSLGYLRAQASLYPFQISKMFQVSSFTYYFRPPSFIMVYLRYLRYSPSFSYSIFMLRYLSTFRSPSLRQLAEAGRGHRAHNIGQSCQLSH